MMPITSNVLPGTAIVAFGEIFGGAERQMLTLARALDELGCPQVRLIVAYDRELARQARAMGLPVTVLSPPRAGFDPTYPRRIYEAIESSGAAWVSLHGYQMTVYASLAGRLRRKVILKTEHGLPEDGRQFSLSAIKSRLYRALELRAMQRLGAVPVYVTQDLMRTCEVRRIGLPSRVIHNGIDIGFVRDTAHPVDWQVPGMHVVALGRLEPVKGFEYLVRAASLAEFPGDARIHVIGSGPEASRLRSLAERLRVQGRVTFEGFQSRPLDFLSAADALVISSMHEGLPYVLLEAMALRIPVVATRVGGLAEVLVDGVDALLVPPADPAAIARALRRIREEPGLAARLVAAATRKVEQQFSACRMASAYLEAFIWASRAK